MLEDPVDQRHHRQRKEEHCDLEAKSSHILLRKLRHLVAPVAPNANAEEEEEPHHQHENELNLEALLDAFDAQTKAGSFSRVTSKAHHSNPKLKHIDEENEHHEHKIALARAIARRAVATSGFAVRKVQIINPVPVVHEGCVHATSVVVNRLVKIGHERVQAAAPAQENHKHVDLIHQSGPGDELPVLHHPEMKKLCPER